MMANKKGWLIAGGVLVVILAAWYAVFCTSYWSPTGYTSEDVLQPTDQTPQEATTTPGAVRPRAPYQAAVQKYQYRMQFNEACQASPAKLTVKNGSSVMFDTRGTGRHTLTVGGKTYTFNGAGFAIVTLSSKTLPHTVQIDCGNGKNNANVVLQK
jgi:plastocyanin